MTAPRVLIIEDEDVIRDLLKDFLSISGYEVDLVTSGEDGLEAAKTRSYAVALADYGLPGMNGLDALRRLHAGDPRLRCILMTGWGSMETAEREPCIDRVIAKPFDLMAVVGTLQELAPVA